VKLQFIENWHRCWRLTSVQAATVLVVLNVLQQEVLPLFGFAIPPQVLPWVNAALGIAVIVARAIAQPDALTGSAPPRSPQ
jgi:hypothetical protein